MPEIPVLKEITEFVDKVADIPVDPIELAHRAHAKVVKSLTGREELSGFGARSSEGGEPASEGGGEEGGVGPIAKALGALGVPNPLNMFKGDPEDGGGQPPKKSTSQWGSK
jgi:hypothetical protein